MKRVFGLVEAVFDILYLLTALILGLVLLLNSDNNAIFLLAGIMAMVLALGDAFHLVPRIILIVMTNKEEQLRRFLGRGKQITSITMTIFYLILWQIGLISFNPKFGDILSYIVYILAAVRILLCLLPHNEWQERYPPVSWGIRRNLPFLILGLMVAGLFFHYRTVIPGLSLLWLAIIVSFAFYLPVVLWSNKNPQIGMLMLPKTCAYLWMLFLFISL